MKNKMRKSANGIQKRGVINPHVLSFPGTVEETEEDEQEKRSKLSLYALHFRKT